MFTRKQHDKPSRMRITSKIMSFMMLLASIAGGVAPTATALAAETGTQQVGSTSGSTGSGSKDTKKQEQTSQTSQSDTDSQPVYGGAANVKSDDQTSDAQPNAPNMPMTATNRANQRVINDMRKGQNSALGKLQREVAKKSGMKAATSAQTAENDANAEQMDPTTRQGYELAKKNGGIYMRYLKSVNAKVPVSVQTGQVFLTKKQMKLGNAAADKKEDQLKGLHGKALVKKANEIGYDYPRGEVGYKTNEIDAELAKEQKAKSAKKSSPVASLLGTVVSPFTHVTARAATVHLGDQTQSHFDKTHYLFMVSTQPTEVTGIQFLTVRH